MGTLLRNFAKELAIKHIEPVKRLSRPGTQMAAMNFVALAVRKIVLVEVARGKFLSWMKRRKLSDGPLKLPRL